jgi:hypothetical protein
VSGEVLNGIVREMPYSSEKVSERVNEVVSDVVRE